jgi:glycosyltransferase involved in cell wall biosynthesis
MFCSNYPPHVGGLEVVAQQLATRLAPAHEVVVVTSAWGEATGVSVEDGVQVHRVPALHASEGWGVPYPVPLGNGIRAALAAARTADVVHAHGALYATSVLAASLSRRIGAPLILTEHVGFVHYSSSVTNSIQRAAWRTLGDRTIASAKAVCVLNERVKAWLRARHPRVRLELIGNGVDAHMFQPKARERRDAIRDRLGLPRQAIVGLFVGRDAAKKNLDRLLEIPRAGFALVLCGARRHIVAPSVTDLGVVHHAEMPDVYAAADFMVLPSSGEGFPVAAQEAMASGLPLVLLWDEGYRRWLDPRMVVACSTLEEVSDRMTWLAGDGAARAQIGASAREWAVERWSWARTVARYECLYNEVLYGQYPDA